MTERLWAGMTDACWADNCDECDDGRCICDCHVEDDDDE
jgi:hypothetical protein